MKHTYGEKYGRYIHFPYSFVLISGNKKRREIIVMDEKKALSSEELNEVNGGGRRIRTGCYIMCNKCKKVFCSDVSPEAVERMLQACRASHKCPDASYTPSDIFAHR